MRAWTMGRVRSFGCAIRGVADLVRTQWNARIHLVATVVVGVMGAVFRVTVGEWCWLMLAMGMVWVAEALNTAVELVADAAVPEKHVLIGRAKDVAAGGVLIAAAVALGIGACVFGPRVGGWVRGLGGG